MLTDFRLAKYRFTLAALERLRLFPYKGNALRGGFGHTFKRIACREGGRCDQRCQQSNACPYGYIFETSPSPGSELLSKNQDIPTPFILEPELDKRELYHPGDRLSFDLVLVGQAINYLLYFIVTFRELGSAGLGVERGKYELYRVTNYAPFSTEEIIMYQVGTEAVQDQCIDLGWPAIQTRAAALPSHRLTLDFLTPTRLKHQGSWIEQGPPFQVLIKALLGRISSLSYFHLTWKIPGP